MTDAVIGIDSLWTYPPKHADSPWGERAPTTIKKERHCSLCGKKLSIYNRRHDVCWGCDERQIDDGLTEMMMADLLRAKGPLCLGHRFSECGFYPSQISQSLKLVQHRLSERYLVKKNKHGHYLEGVERSTP